MSTRHLPHLLAAPVTFRDWVEVSRSGYQWCVSIRCLITGEDPMPSRMQASIASAKLAPGLDLARCIRSVVVTAIRPPPTMWRQESRSALALVNHAGQEISVADRG